MSVTERPKATALVPMPAPVPSSRQYSFTGGQVGNPAAPPPGDRLDAEFDRLRAAISAVIDWVEASLAQPALRDSGDDNAASDAEGAAALAYRYAILAQAWAEYMPGTIPPNILAVMDITGDHWSSRWWANLAAHGDVPPPAPASSDGVTNVKDFGAKGNGTADDTMAFQAALSAIAEQAGGKLYMPSGNYKITGTLSYPAGFLQIAGDGPDSTIQFGSTTATLFSFAGTDITLTDFRVVTPYQTSTAGTLFKFLNASNIRLDRVSTDGGYEAVQFLGAPGNLTYRTTITNCHFVNVMDDAVFYDPYFGGIGMISDTDIRRAGGPQ